MGSESCRLEGTSRSHVVQDIAKSQASQSRWIRAMFCWILKISQPPEVLVPVFEHPHRKKFLTLSSCHLLQLVFLVSHPSTVNICRESDPVFYTASQQGVVVRLKIFFPLSVLETGQVHLSQSLISCHAKGH